MVGCEIGASIAPASPDIAGPETLPRRAIVLLPALLVRSEPARVSLRVWGAWLLLLSAASFIASEGELPDVSYGPVWCSSHLFVASQSTGS